ncbi:hypothetical protein [Coleofasciculus chthonoplastes]|uniref:hypothetical protein n=1 Tax=Coleofasciculus chthonoplastes TaxID=64178 RepID=UPI0032FD92CA
MPQKGDRTQSIHTYPMKKLNASSALAVAPQFAAIRTVFPPDGDYQRQRRKRSTGNVFTALNPAQKR